MEGDLLGGGDDDAAHIFRHLFPLQNSSGLPQVLDAPIGAGADHHLVDVQAGHLADHLGVLGEMGHGDGGFQLVQIDDYLPCVDRIGIGLKGLAGTAHPAVDILHGLLVYGEDSVLAAGLDGHVGDGEAVVHGQGGHALPGELQGLIQGTVHPDLADQVQDHILAADAGLELPLQGHLDGRGDLEPQQAGGHARSHVGGADAGGEGTQRAVGAGMGVGPHDDLSRGGQPLLGDQGVLYAHLAHVVEMGDAVLMGKLPCLLAQLGRLDILAGGIVVQHNGDPVLVKDLGEASLLKLRDGHRGGDIVAQDQVQPGFDQLARLD